jgi:3-isopropylmalate dehydrogenase
MKILVLPGDGIGPEVTAQAVRVLQAVLAGRMPLELTEAPIGSAGYAAAGDPLPDGTLRLARAADGILFGAVGTPDDERLPPGETSGSGLLRLRKALGFFANFRPAFLFPELIGASTLKPEIVRGLDLLIIRELTGDLYFGEPRGIHRDETGDRIGINTMRYSEPEVERIAHLAFRVARGRRSKLCSVDKANVLEAMALWRQVFVRVGRTYPDVALQHLYVDAAAMALLRKPTAFDVIVTGNVFGDILSDEAAMLAGSIGMLPSGSVGYGKKGLYEPVHGSAPDIAGQDLANPLASILSVAMMLRQTFELEEPAAEIERAVRAVLAEGYRTADIEEPGTYLLGTTAMGDAVIKAIGRHQ